MVEKDDIRTSADGWRTFLDKLAQIRDEAEKRGLSDIVDSLTQTSAVVAERLKQNTH